MARYPISYSRLMRRIGDAVGLRPRDAWLEISGSEVEVRMGWGFQARFPRAAVVTAERSDRAYASQGVHGWRGRWLVNGSSRGVVWMELAPQQQARVLGKRVRLSVLGVSVQDPDALVAALRDPGGAG